MLASRHLPPYFQTKNQGEGRNNSLVIAWKHRLEGVRELIIVGGRGTVRVRVDSEARTTSFNLNSPLPFVPWLSHSSNWASNHVFPIGWLWEWKELTQRMHLKEHLAHSECSPLTGMANFGWSINSYGLKREAVIKWGTNGSWDSLSLHTCSIGEPAQGCPGKLPSRHLPPFSKDSVGSLENQLPQSWSLWPFSLSMKENAARTSLHSQSYQRLSGYIRLRVSK